MTEVKTSEDVIMELKAEIEALKCAIAEQQEKAEAKRIIDFNKVKNTLDDGAKTLLAAVKPVIEKYEEPGRAAVNKVGTRVSDNPFLCRGLQNHIWSRQKKVWRQSLPS